MARKNNYMGKIYQQLGSAQQAERDAMAKMQAAAQQFVEQSEAAPGSVQAAVTSQSARGETPPAAPPGSPRPREKTIADRLNDAKVKAVWAQVGGTGGEPPNEPPGQPLPSIPKDMDFATFSAMQRAARGEAGPPKPEGAPRPPRSQADVWSDKPKPTPEPRPDVAAIKESASGVTGPPKPDAKPAPQQTFDQYLDAKYGPENATKAAASGATGPPKPPGSVEPKPGEDKQLLTEIRDAIKEQTKKAATGQLRPNAGPKPAEADNSPKPDLLDHLQPSADMMQRFGHGPIRKIGHAIKGAKRVRDWFRGTGPKGGKLPGSGAKPPTAKPPAGGKPPVPPVATGAAGGAGEAAGAGAAAEAGGMAAAAGPAAVVVAATLALVMLAKAGRDLAYQQEEHARKLAEMSPSQAANIAVLDAQRQMRQVQEGEATAGSGQGLTEAIDRFEQALQPIEIVVTNLLNNVGAGVLDALSELIEIGNNVADLVKQIPGVKGLLEEQPNKQGEFLGDFLDKIHKEQEQKAREAANRLDAARRANRAGRP